MCHLKLLFLRALLLAEISGCDDTVGASAFWYSNEGLVEEIGPKLFGGLSWGYGPEKLLPRFVNYILLGCVIIIIIPRILVAFYLPLLDSIPSRMSRLGIPNHTYAHRYVL